jgi:phosphopantothenoylcysteine decarboxylase/phosphopantothenate--cysteine ligase
MGVAVALAARRAGHQVTLLCGPVTLPGDLGGVQMVGFVSVADLQRELSARFSQCDALVMSAAVGDFAPLQVLEHKIPRAGGPVTITLLPTPDVLASVTAGKKPGQTVVAFAVEDGPEPQITAKALAELAAKNADFVVLNTPAAMGAASSRACILSRTRAVLDWADRPKEQLAEEIVQVLTKANDKCQMSNDQ